MTDKTGALGAPLFDKLDDTTTVRDLCKGDFISTPSCMIRNRQVKKIPDWIYDLPGCDWPFDILNAECGKIKCLPGLMAAYRQHDNSMWSSLNMKQQYWIAVKLGIELNVHFGFKYKKEFEHYIALNKAALFNSMTPEKASSSEKKRSLLYRAVFSPRWKKVKPHLKQARLAIKAGWKEWRNSLRPFELVIADDAYPHPQSAFRLEEYDAYLRHFKRSVVYTTGRAFTFFREIRSVTDVIRAHESDHRGVSGRITILDRTAPVHGRLAYTIFAGNAWDNIEYFERNHLPFVFTLYPGGSFYLNDAASDERLRRVFASKMFRRVIVTQKITRDYLLEKNFCPLEKIEFIYGVVTPRINLDNATREHRHFGFGKSTLDICFTAHKYTPDGHDKGYDLFLEVARRLAATLPECRFHVVGGFNVEDLPIDGLEDRITFYGGQTQEWLFRFYQDKDIILLCNVPFVIAPGAFDGFPTGCGSDAMLNGVAQFCTDPLKLNLEFKVERDLVIVPHDADVIVERLMWYRNNPAALRNIAEAGKNRALEVYSFESQIKPRIDILNREIERSRSWP